ncbi:triacylglycerol lipase [Oleiphilus messinensis]|uniref:Triacylglycerol lipase n=1 Tax=Oleiphilus messinensis TaxID=141451 RepID=A0A1Y0IFL9_9GAMM|nr:lipase family protein [Oleiphilus messinensis]ARU59327.1 triacylglycerol lipase [Oleiphilus messinensis]
MTHKQPLIPVHFKKRSFLVALALSLPLQGLSLQANASAVVGPDNMNFYSPPAMSSGDHGDLIWYREANITLNAQSPAVKAWDVLYHSTDAIGQPNVVSGTIIVPDTSWTGSGSRPMITYGVATHGLAQGCAPSLQLAAGTEYEEANLNAALQRGYAVLVSDNPGYTNDSGVTPYMVGKAQAHAALDIVTAAGEIPGAIDPNAKLGIWGYSQGGQTAAWAGELQPSYAPQLNLVGVASGGTPADLLDTAFYLNGSTGSSFFLGAIIGLSTQYPAEIPIEDEINAAGSAALATAKNQCIFESLFEFMNDDIDQYTLGNRGLDELLTELPEAAAVVEEQSMAQEKMKAPLYLYHGQADEFIPLDQNYDLKRQYCRLGSNVTFDLYPSEHVVTQFQAAPFVLDWLDNRMKGYPTLGSCITFKPRPQSTANPGGGNFIVSLDEWPLTASMHLKSLDQTVNLPKKSTFSADTDMTAQTLDGTMTVPDFSTKLNIVLPLDVKLSVKPAQATNGTVQLDNNGILSISGNAYADITVKSAGISFFQIPFGCQTESAVAFPLEFTGPVSSLGDGQLTFTGTTSFPAMKNCGLFNGLFTTLMSGPGQQYSFNVAPPEPKRN